MPLYSIDNKLTPVASVPHHQAYLVWRNRLSSEQHRQIMEKLNSMIDSDEVHTSSWMPGHNWGGTVFEPIWETACLRNEEAAAKCFGIMLWEVMMARPEDWSFGKFEKDNVQIEGMTYFKIHR